MTAHTDSETIDLSIGLESDAASEPWPPEIDYIDHTEGAEILSERLQELGAEEMTPGDFPDGIAHAWEELEVMTHTGTHMDAPWHYGPEVGDSPARTIDEVPIDWCHGEAVVLDFREKPAGSEITIDDIEGQLDALDHELSAGEIVLLETGGDELWGTPEYLTEFPGMNAESTKYLVERGVRVIGTDAYGFDKPFADMAERYAETGDSDELWPAHFAGRDVEYCHIEKMANLDRLPRRTGIYLTAFPIKIENASAGWVRPVAHVEER